MKKAGIALVLALSLLLSGWASAEARLPEGFATSNLLSIYNDQLVQSFMAIKPTETATKVSLYRTYDMTAEGNAIRMSNLDGKVTLTATLPEGETDPSETAVALAFTVDSGVDLMDYPVLKSAFANVIARADSTANLQSLTDWMDNARKSCDALALNGYTLSYTQDGSARTFTLVADGTDDAVPEPKAETEPTVDATPEPTVDATPESTVDAAPEPTRAARAEADALVSWKGFELTPLRTERWQFANGYISLRLYLRVVNETGTKLSVRPEDMTVDGVALPATNIFDIETGTDTGENSEEGILIYVDENITDSVRQAVLYGEDMSVKLVLYDSKTYEDLYMEKVSLDLGPLPNETTIIEPSGDTEPTPTPQVAATSAPEATRAPEGNAYTSLFEGDKGEEVRRMQRRLIELGFLNDTADGEYGPRTAAAVRAFCEANNLVDYSYASSSMLERLYSSYATPYQEPWVPLVFQEGAWGEWRKARDDQLGFHAKVTNTSRTHTVKAFELYMYATDVWGDRIYGERLFYGTSTKTVKPGASVYSDYFLLPNRSQIATVWCGIKKVIFSDGTIRENDTVDYTSWTVK